MKQKYTQSTDKKSFVSGNQENRQEKVTVIE